MYIVQRVFVESHKTRVLVRTRFGDDGGVPRVTWMMFMVHDDDVCVDVDAMVAR